mgnify:CR=1 FL=1
MKINENHIYLYVNEFYDIDVKDRKRDDDLIIARMFFYYLSLKYCTTIVNYNTLARFIGLEHGCVLSAMNRVNAMSIYENNNYKRLQHLEKEFIKDFNITKNDFELPITKKEILILNRKLRHNKKTVKDLRSENIKLNRKLKSIKKLMSSIDLNKDE